mmetsp:Transcript_29466/g.76049  ORF Transcript_29466/g.76049 Transcript_29466/m.76049 type:complete len:99 (+) Transcript_29466:405-701(+)
MIISADAEKTNRRRRFLLKRQVAGAFNTKSVLPCHLSDQTTEYTNIQMDINRSSISNIYIRGFFFSLFSSFSPAHAQFKPKWRLSMLSAILSLITSML